MSVDVKQYGFGTHKKVKPAFSATYILGSFIYFFLEKILAF